MAEKRARAMRSDAVASRERFMDTAARLYVDVGYNGCTIRLIAQQAKTSLARLNRHWTGKEQLFGDVFARHFAPIHAAQEAGLDRLAAAGLTDRAELLTALVRAFYEPALVAEADTDGSGIGHRVYGRALVDPAPEVRRIVQELATGLARRVSDLLRRVMPDADAETFFWSHALLFGTYLHAQLFSARVAESVGIDTPVDWTRAAPLLAEMLLHGLPISGKDAPRRD